MKTSRFGEGEIIGFLKQAAAWLPIKKNGPQELIL